MAETQIVEKEEDKDDRLSSLFQTKSSSKFCHSFRSNSPPPPPSYPTVGVNFFDCVSESTDIIDLVLQKLTSRKLHQFVLDFDYFDEYPEDAYVSESVSWFRQVCSRNVENIIFTTPREQGYSYRIPSCLFNSQSLVTLRLYSSFIWPKFKGLRFHLPNLKMFDLDDLDDIPCWFNAFIKACPLLELLEIVFNLEMYSTLSNSDVNIIAPNLKSLSITMEFQYQSMVKRPRVYIDAPKLANLEIHDCNSIYYFLRNPTALVKAHIDLKDNAKLWQYLDEEGNGSLEGAQKEYLRQMANFVRGLSSASNLKLKLKSPTNIFRYGSFVNLPIFSNLTRLETKGTMDLLRSLHCFPNLEHLVVCLWSEDLQPLETLGFLMEQSYWLPPDSIPDCLLGKLKTIQLSEIQGTDDTLRLLVYILSNANVLEKLCIRLRLVESVNPKHEREEAYAMWKECQFCKSLFKLPRRSSTCEVVFSGSFFRASGNALPDGYLSCQMYVGR